MKRNLLLILSALVLLSCENLKEEDKVLKNEIASLEKKKADLQASVNGLHYEVNKKVTEVSTLEEKVRELKIYESGKVPHYILKLHLKQSHFTLSIKKHIKDAMNAIDFEMPVSKEFYESVSVGTEIVDNFRAGSFLLYGSFGDWSMTVKAKEIRK